MGARARRSVGRDSDSCTSTVALGTARTRVVRLVSIPDSATSVTSDRTPSHNYPHTVEIQPSSRLPNGSPSCTPILLSDAPDHQYRPPSSPYASQPHATVYSQCAPAISWNPNPPCPVSGSGSSSACRSKTPTLHRIRDDVQYVR